MRRRWWKPNCTFSMRDHFTYRSENLVYCISCSRYSHRYIGVDLVSICEAYAITLLVFLWHNISTLWVTVSKTSRCGMHLCSSTNILCNKLEMKLIFRLETLQPDGLNAYALPSNIFTDIAYFNGFQSNWRSVIHSKRLFSETILTLFDIYCFEYQLKHFQPSATHHRWLFSLLITWSYGHS